MPPCAFIFTLFKFYSQQYNIADNATVLTVTIFLGNLPLMAWYSIDCLERSIILTKKIKYLFLIFGLFILLIHFLKTRGEIKGLFKFLCFILFWSILFTIGEEFSQLFIT